MQTLTNLVQTLTIEVAKIRNDITQYNDITTETNGIKQQLYSTQGRLACLTKRHDELEDKLTSYQQKDFEHDLVLYNMTEPQHENDHTLKMAFYKFFTDIMMIPQDIIFSRDNPAGEIRIDAVVRQGKYIKDKSRPVIVTFLTRTGRNLVYSKQYTKHLANLIRVRVAEHYPSISKEKRQAQIEILKNLREDPNNKDSVISLRKDKIYVNGKEKSSDLFKRNTLTPITPLSIAYNQLEHSESNTHKQSTFQAHSLQIQSKDQAAAALNAIYRNPELATASHRIYAYKLGIPGGETTVQSGYTDDGETEGGHRLMNLINIRNLTNVFICVTRLKEGPNIGKMRFKLIEKCAEELLSAEDFKEDPIFHRVALP